MAALLALLRLTKKVSFGSVAVSPLMVTEKVRLVAPAAITRPLALAAT